jgi:D-alanyl-D-alanine carboxypeptidase
MPNEGRITVRMLLTQTSGLPDYLYEPSFDRAAKNPRRVWSRDTLLAGVHGSDFPPGTHSEYSNTNYLVLGGILVKAGGKPVERTLQEGIAKPLGLTLTTFTHSASCRQVASSRPTSTDTTGSATPARTAASRASSGMTRRAA